MASEPRIFDNMCPLCGQTNDCAISRGLPIEACWCNSRTVESAAIEQIADQLKYKQCLCAQCAANLGEPAIER